MKGRMLKLLADHFIPPRYYRLLYGKIVLRRALRLTAHESAILSRNAKFRNMYAGKRCFVIGNGPSLNKQDLAPLANEVTIAMNLFNKNPIIEKWKPTFLCVAETTAGLKPEELTIFADCMYNIEAQAYFFRLDVKEILDKDRLLDQENIYYLKMSGGPLYDWPTDRSLDLTKVIPGARTTAHMAIMIALYLGCSPIYLIGLDHDWLSHRSVERHFYASSPQGVQGSCDLSNYSYKRLIAGTLKTWRIYESFQDIARKQGVKIYNATAGGFLDVFERVAYNSLFK